MLFDWIDRFDQHSNLHLHLKHTLNLKMIHICLQANQHNDIYQIDQHRILCFELSLPDRSQSNRTPRHRLGRHQSTELYDPPYQGCL